MPEAGTAAVPELNRRQRRHPRHRCSFPVIVTVFAGDNYQRLDAHCKDLSQAGMGILLASELAAGEVVSLAFSLPGVPSTWEVRAILRHRRGYQYGLEFISLTTEQSRTMRQFVRDLDLSD
jgi:c-di-GMP-binding flagellar brake protein YcgR